MQYLYTTDPDDKCHEIKDGIYGRPVHSSQMKAFRAKGWKSRIQDLEINHGLRKDEKEGREEGKEVNQPADNEETGYSDYDILALHYEAVFGKKPHHKMKPETIREKLEQADDQS